MTSIGSEAGNISRAVEQTRARIEEIQARVRAIEELEAQGLITDVFADGQDNLERRLKQLSIDAAVEAELAKLKAGMSANL